MKSMNEILDDLYKLDPSLREKDARMKEIVQAMLSRNPDAPMNDAFKKRLKNQIMSEIRKGEISKIAQTRNKNHRFLMIWKSFGIIALASFVWVFGFFLVFQWSQVSETDHVWKISAPVSENTDLARNTSPEDIKNLALNTPTPETATESVKIEKTPIKKDTESTKLKTTELRSKADDSEKRNDSVTAERRIAYVGIKVDPSSNTPAMRSMPPMLMQAPSADSPESAWMTTSDTSSTSIMGKQSDNYGASGGAIASSGSEKKTPEKTTLPFEAILSKAEKEALEVIGKEDPSLYVLDTPTVEYVPENNDSGAEASFDLSPVYIFPLKKAQDMKKMVKEIIIPASGD